MTKIINECEEFIINKYLNNEISNLVKERLVEAINVANTNNEEQKKVLELLQHDKYAFNSVKYILECGEMYTKDGGFETRNEFKLALKGLAKKRCYNVYRARS